MATPTDYCVSPFNDGVDVADFDCGNVDLNEFLTTDEVLNYQNEWCGYTYLVHRISDWALVGFYTIAADSIDLPKDWIKKKSMETHLGTKRLPAILLGRFATDNRYKKRLFGLSCG